MMPEDSVITVAYDGADTTDKPAQPVMVYGTSSVLGTKATDWEIDNPVYEFTMPAEAARLNTIARTITVESATGDSIGVLGTDYEVKTNNAFANLAAGSDLNSAQFAAGTKVEFIVNTAADKAGYVSGVTQADGAEAAATVTATNDVYSVDVVNADKTITVSYIPTYSLTFEFVQAVGGDDALANVAASLDSIEVKDDSEVTTSFNGIEKYSEITIAPKEGYMINTLTSDGDVITTTPGAVIGVTGGVIDHVTKNATITLEVVPVYEVQVTDELYTGSIGGGSDPYGATYTGAYYPGPDPVLIGDNTPIIMPKGTTVTVTTTAYDTSTSGKRVKYTKVKDGTAEAYATFGGGALNAHVYDTATYTYVVGNNIGETTPEPGDEIVMDVYVLARNSVTIKNASTAASDSYTVEFVDSQAEAGEADRTVTSLAAKTYAELDAASMNPFVVTKDATITIKPGHQSTVTGVLTTDGVVTDKGDGTWTVTGIDDTAVIVVNTDSYYLLSYGKDGTTESSSPDTFTATRNDSTVSVNETRLSKDDEVILTPAAGYRIETVKAVKEDGTEEDDPRAAIITAPEADSDIGGAYKVTVNTLDVKLYVETVPIYALTLEKTGEASDLVALEASAPMYNLSGYATGDAVTVTVSAATGKTLDEVDFSSDEAKLNKSVDGTGNYTVTNPDDTTWTFNMTGNADLTFTYTANLKIYNVTTGAATNGSVTVSDNAALNPAGTATSGTKGTKIFIKAAPDAGYHLKDNSLEVKSTVGTVTRPVAPETGEGIYSFELDSFDVKVTADFEPDKFTVSKNEVNTTVTFTSDVDAEDKADYESTVGVTITPAEGCEIDPDNVYLLEKKNGEWVKDIDHLITRTNTGTTFEGTFTMPMHDVIVYAQADSVPHRITVSKNDLFVESVSVSTMDSPVATDAGKNEIVNVSLAFVDGYELDEIRVTTSANVVVPTNAISEGSKYTFAMADDDVIISVIAKARKYVVDKAELHATVDITAGVDDSNCAAYKDTVKFTVTPDADYRMPESDGVKVSKELGYVSENALPDASGVYSFEMPACPVTIRTYVAPIPYGFTVSADEASHATVNSDLTSLVVADGANETKLHVIFTPGYKEDGFKVLNAAGAEINDLTDVITATTTDAGDDLTYIVKMPSGGISSIMLKTTEKAYSVVEHEATTANPNAAITVVGGELHNFRSTVSFDAVLDEDSTPDAVTLYDKESGALIDLAVSGPVKNGNTYSYSFIQPAQAVKVRLTTIDKQYPVNIPDELATMMTVTSDKSTAAKGEVVKISISQNEVQKAGYRITSRKVFANDVDGNATTTEVIPSGGGLLTDDFTFNMVRYGVTIEIKYEAIVYAVDSTNAAKKTRINVTGDKESAACGENVEFMVLPGSTEAQAADYTINDDSIKVYKLGEDEFGNPAPDLTKPVAFKSADNESHTYSVVMPEFAIIICAEAHGQLYNVTLPAAAAHSTISANTLKAEAGDDVTLTILCDEGYALKGLNIGETAVDVADVTYSVNEPGNKREYTYVFSQPSGGTKIAYTVGKADYALYADPYNCEVTLPSVLPTDEEFASTVNFKAVPYTDFEFNADSVKVYRYDDYGIAPGSTPLDVNLSFDPATGEGSFTMPAYDVILAVDAFDIIYPVTVVSENNVTTTASHDAAKVDTIITINAVYEYGYSLDELTIVNAATGEAVPYNLTRNPNEYTYVQPSGGSIVTLTARSADHDIQSKESNSIISNLKSRAAYEELVSFNAAPADGYKLVADSIKIYDTAGNDITADVKLKGDIGTVYVEGDYSFTMPNEIVKIVVTAVKKVSYKITYVYDKNALSFETLPEKAFEYDLIDTGAKAKSGYQIDGISVTDAEGNAVTASADGSFRMPESDVTVEFNTSRKAGGEPTEDEKLEAKVSENAAKLAEINDMKKFNGDVDGILQDKDDNATTILHFKRKKVKTVSISENMAGTSEVTLNARLQVSGLKGCTVVSAYNGTEWKGISNIKLPKISKKGILKLKSLKNAPVYTVVVKTEKGTITIHVRDIAFDVNIKRAKLMMAGNTTSGNEAIIIEPTVKVTNESADFASGYWIMNKRTIVKNGVRQAITIKGKTYYATANNDGSILIEQDAGGGVNKISAKYVLNGRIYKTTVKIGKVAPTGEKAIAANNALKAGSKLNRNKIFLK
ncbi:MAG: hypothetical protein IKR68_07725 [Lachnospiraceae bacterium]|nr:hypothetical protein [Lachnospiraceae bacterium]